MVPNRCRLVLIAPENGGADALAIINSVVGMAVDPYTWHTRITNNRGGSWYPTSPQISNHDDTPIEVTDSVIE